MSLERKLNIKYFLVQSLYWSGLCCTTAFASAYMSGMGYTNAIIGITLAASYLVSAVLQQRLTALADASVKFDALRLSLILSFAIFATSLGNAFISEKNAVEWTLFFIALCVTAVLMPFVSSLNFYLEKHGVSINFGFARAGGSFLYFVVSLILGYLMEDFSVNLAPAFGGVLYILMFAVLVSIMADLRKSKEKPQESNARKATGNGDSKMSLAATVGFMKMYKMFFVFLLGVIGYYFSHIIDNNFMYQIVVNVGGDVTDNGGIIAVSALTEIPVMVFTRPLIKKFGCKKLLGVSAVAFTLKIAVTALASNVFMLYFVTVLQPFAYGIFASVSVYLVNEIINPEDEVKGQGFLGIAMTAANFLAGIFGGFGMDAFGVTGTLWITSFIALIGTLTALYALRKM